jgi:hypothetical protein
MKKVFTLAIGMVLTFLLGAAPAQAQNCSVNDTQAVRELLVPITRLSAHQGRNTAENQEVISSIRKMIKATPSNKLRNSLKELRALVKKGELNQGSTLYWGYKDGSVWKTYKKVLVLTQKDGC